VAGEPPALQLLPSSSPKAPIFFLAPRT